MAEAVPNPLPPLARQIYDELGYTDSALDEFAQRVSAEPMLLKRALREAGISCLLAAQRDARSRANQAAEAVGPAPRVITPQYQAEVAAACRTLLSWPMMGGGRLGDATREEVLSDAARYTRNAQGNARSARFLRLVAERLQPGQCVRNVFTGGQGLGELMRAARCGDSEHC